MSNEMKEYLEKIISIPSVSSDPSKKKFSLQTADLVVSKLQELGAEVKIVPNEVKEKNPLIFGKLGSDPEKKTMLFYSHYDVQPALKEDGWETDPFTVVEKIADNGDGYYYGRGVTDDKGPIVVVYQAIRELLQQGDLPVNVFWLYEGEEESGSGGFEETVSKNHSFFSKVDGLLIMDVGWEKEEIPAIVYGTRGIVYAFIEISGPKKDVHSGTGGTFQEPMTDLIQILSKLIDSDGKILVEGIYDSVKPLTKEEEALYVNNEFDIEEYKKMLGYTTKWKNENPFELLMNLWRYPSLTIHGIEGAFYGPGAKTVIPGKVIGKVSIRTVPDQKPKEIGELFKKYVEKEFAKLNSPNKLKFEVPEGGDWWFGDPNTFLFKANEKAIKEYWKKDPAFSRGGGSIPIIPFMEKTFNCSAMGVATGQPSGGAHSQNERIRIKNLVGSKEVVKLMLKNLGSV